jgi:hypothetical protein
MLKRSHKILYMCWPSVTATQPAPNAPLFSDPGVELIAGPSPGGG